MLLLVATILTSAARAACPGPTTAGWLDEQITQAEIAFVTDPDTTRLTIQRVEAGLPCVDAALDARLVGRLHRLEGLGAFLDDQEDRAARSFAAARNANQAITIPTTLAPPSHALHGLFSRVDLATLPRAAVSGPGWGVLLLDGQPTDQRATTIPVLVQQLDDRGVALTTALLGPGEPTPAWVPRPQATLDPVLAEPPLQPAPLQAAPPLPEPSRARPSWAALGLGLAGGAAGGVMYWKAAELQAEYLAMSDAERAERGQEVLDLNHALIMGSAGAGGVGVVLAVGGLSWWRH